QRSLLLGQCREKMQDEGIGLAAQFGDDELNALRHQSADEMHVAAKAIEPRHHDWTPILERQSNRRRQFWPAFHSVGTRPSLNLCEPARQRNAFPLGKVDYGRPLSL